MRIYWYWPFARPEDLVLAAAVPGDGDSICVHAIAGRLPDRRGRADGGCEVVAALPAVAAHTRGSPAWLASRGATYVRRARARDRFLATRDFDVAHVFYLNYFTDGRALRSLRRRLPVVSTVHDVVPHERRVPRGVERRLLARQYREAGTLVVHHERVRERLLRDFHVDPARVHLVPHWVIPSDPAPRERPGDPPVVLFFGTLRHNKGVEILLDAIERTRRAGAGDEVRFVIAGGGAPEIEAAVRAAAARDPRIAAEIGYATPERKHDLYQRADLVVLPYTAFASQSGVLHDAYSRHAPVVVTEVGALGDTVREDGTGWVIPPSDPEALARAIVGALADRDALRSASAAAAAVATARHPAVIGAALRAVYREAAGRA